MKFRDWWVKVTKRGSLKDWSWWKQQFPAYFNENTVAVTPVTSLQTSAVYACVRIIAGTIASMPFVVHQETSKGNISAFKHDQFRLLKLEPNSNQSSFVFRFNLVMQYLLWGNGYAEIKRNGLGRPVEYIVLPSAEVKPDITESGEVFYRYNENGVDRIIKKSNMIHIFDMSLNGIEGVSRITLARESISMLLSGIQFGNKFYQNGTMIGGWLEFQKTIKDEDIARYRTTWKAVNGGLNSVGEVAILDQGTKYNPHKIQMPLNDAQYIESMHFQVVDIARIFNVPPHKIGDLQKSSFNNIEQQAIEFVENCILPVAKMIEQEFDRKIFRQRETDHYVKIELKGLLRGDISARGEYQAKMFDRGVFSINDIRKLEDMEMVDNGDYRFVPLNFTTVEKAVKEIEDEGTEGTAHEAEEGTGDL